MCKKWFHRGLDLVRVLFVCKKWFDVLTWYVYKSSLIDVLDLVPVLLYAIIGLIDVLAW